MSWIDLVENNRPILNRMNMYKMGIKKIEDFLLNT